MGTGEKAAEKALEGLSLSLDGDVVWADLKGGWQDIQRWFSKKRAPGDYGETFSLSDESLAKYRSIAKTLGAEEEIAGEATLSEPVKGLGHCQKKFTWKAKPGYIITKMIAEDLRKDGKNGSVFADLTDTEVTGYVKGLTARACRWRFQVYTLRIS